MEATCSSEMSVYTTSICTTRQIPEDGILHWQVAASDGSFRTLYICENTELSEMKCKAEDASM
jgi:hypothetical protein